ncbi:EH domain-containing protein 2 [Glycine soja]
MAQHSHHVPKFGNWDTDNVPYTSYFENARREKSGIMINPNDPMENPEAFNTCIRVDADEVMMASHGYSHNVHSLENGSHVRRRSRGSNGELTVTAEFGASEQSHFDHSVNHKRNMSKGGSNIKGFSSSSHNTQRTANSSFSDHSNHRATAIPKFGTWDVTNPKSAEGYTAIFSKIKEERQIKSSHVSSIHSTPPLNNSNIKNQYGESSSWLSKTSVKVNDKKRSGVTCERVTCGRKRERSNGAQIQKFETTKTRKEASNAVPSTQTSNGDGRISGNDATKFFALSNLSRSQLKQLWALADVKRQGFLGFTEFVTAMQLVSLAQAGQELKSDILKTQSKFDKENIKPPVLEGLDALVALSLNSVTSIIDGLKRLYIERLKPLEVAYQYNDFVSPLLTNTDFDAKPMVMLLGQYSTGKTTFIKHLLKCDYPGAHVGPEPTTDRFVVVMSGPDERSIPGNTIAVDADMPFGGLTTFGGSFLSKFQCSQMPHPLLDEVTFVDTPGVLSGEKQRTQRSYDFTGVVSWFAAKCDLILLLFDPHKLDISDEFKRVIASLHGNDDKIRVVLNKADQVDTQQLMRVYGALMWSLGKVLNTPEVTRVYIGSFNDKPMDEGFVSPLGQDLFEKEQNNLLADLMDIPKKACDRRINEFVKRARSAKIHAYIISHLKKEMPAIMGKAKARQRLLDNLEEEFAKVQREFHLPAGDFPNVEHFREVLNGYNIDKFEKLKPKMIQAVDDMLGFEIPELLKKFRNPYD